MELVLFAMLGAGITVAQVPEPQMENPVPRVGVACVGDSITAGARIKDREQSYPAQLGAMLGSGYEVRNFGRNSTTLLRKAKPWRNKQAFEFEPDIVVIQLGTNDSKEKFWEHKDYFESDYISLIRRFQGLDSRPRVLICFPIPCHKNHPVRGKVITDEIIPTIAEMVHKTEAEVVDLHKALRGKKKLFADEVHPNRDGAKLIAETVKVVILTPEKNESRE